MNLQQTFFGTNEIDLFDTLINGKYLNTMAGNDSVIVNHVDFGAVLNGGDDTDLLSYSSSNEGLYIRLDKGWVTSIDNKSLFSWTDLNAGIADGSIAHDTVENFEILIASDYADIIQGSSNADTIYGMSGNDYINGGAGFDSLYGGNGDDLIKTGKGWGDFVDGGEGNDTINFFGETSEQGVYARMDKGWATDYQNKFDYTWKEINSKIESGELAADKFVNVENFTGTNFRDIIQGSSGDNIIKGAGGADYINGGLGSDTASYFGSTVDGHGVNVRLDQGFSVSMADRSSLSWKELLQAVKSGQIEADKLVSIENAIGSKYNDAIQGDRFDNRLEGAQGNDFLNGGDGNDVLVGGSGIDRLVGGRGDDTFYADETDRPINGGQGFDLIAKMDDVDGDNAVDIDLGNSKYNSIEAFIGNSNNDVNYTLNVSLDKVAQQSEGTYDDMFFAIGIDTLTFSEQVEQQSTQELEGDYEAELVALLGLDASAQLKETVYLTENNNLVTVIEEVIEESVNDVSGAGSFDFENQEMTYIV
ncbi:hypothetical protein HH219_00025 [Pseudoalteromonas sp. NEC-BIFX-2020_015]|uniref:calcium-binding protein n=1 Tax=Pseudoalteromonas sp. NEC-BIFX-2020_015 TaxID=2729544 RepID=UPI00146132C0|nr:calcium-binding protein [Pseudoalteromonas sp. NEC-BIFX-2020_015]NMR23943.1 hypothetical protein [Pseudoalteromonas sp. NEC-BIFX-2020_015]